MSAVATKGVGWNKRSTYIAQNANQGRGLAVVQGAGGDDYAAVAGSDAVCLGVQEEASLNAGDPISIIDLGETIAIAGGAVNAGQFVKSSAAGTLVPVGGVSDNIVGQAKSSAAQAGDEFVIMVLPSVL